jgi:2-polyprenyl-6-methoxyphenol hydroxylase-like FAD-dependent oxidoreductase
LARDVPSNLPSRTFPSDALLARADELARHSEPATRSEGPVFVLWSTIKSGFNPVSDSEMHIYLLQNVAERPRWHDEELPGMLRGLLAEFGGVLGRARDEVRDPDRIMCCPVFSIIMPPPWHCGRVVVIGDAAHTMTPQLASGATIAIKMP